MDKNSKQSIWLPVIIAVSIALGIFVGNHYRTLSGYRSGNAGYGGGNKIDAILNIINKQYVDTVNMEELI